MQEPRYLDADPISLLKFFVMSACLDFVDYVLRSLCLSVFDFGYKSILQNLGQFVARHYELSPLALLRIRNFPGIFLSTANGSSTMNTYGLANEPPYPVTQYKGCFNSIRIRSHTRDFFAAKRYKLATGVFPLKTLAVRTAPEGDFSSPGFPVQYPPYLDTAWRIEQPKGHRIRLQFLKFSVEWDIRCSFDKVTVYDGYNSSAKKLGVYCGNDLPHPLISTGRFLYIRMLTDNSVSSPGFLAHYKCFKDPTVEDTTTQSVATTATETTSTTSTTPAAGTKVGFQVTEETSTKQAGRRPIVERNPDVPTIAQWVAEVHRPSHHSKVQSLRDDPLLAGDFKWFLQNSETVLKIVYETMLNELIADLY
ncbi:bone morphogenetic protein 1 [Clonorchis sinensis]|uniref:Bone morphogenetic protein 1 n=1 Tax=Clonorchis sinensis TaxID=79923 RepID=H2KUV4_CLOSI|nr:bone morphogenetic protein 1 [Clonorchis sinensis]